jgi:hypothetical protein
MEFETLLDPATTRLVRSSDVQAERFEFHIFRKKIFISQDFASPRVLK